MSVTVVIPTHNRRAGLTGLLRDLREQDAPVAPEVIVVDSPVGEDIGDVVDAARTDGQNVRRILTENALTAKRNAGAHAATGDLLCFLDDDMRLPATWLRGHLDAHAQRPDVCVSGDIHFPKPWVRASNYYRFKEVQHRNAPDGDPVLTDLPAHRIVVMNMSIPRELFLRVGGNDPEFTRYGGEDIEFGFRLTRAGVPLLFAPQAWAWHEEVKLDVVGFARKLYTAAYDGAPTVVAKAPEARGVRTFRWSEPGMQSGALDRAANGALRMLARPGFVVRFAKTLRRIDAQPLLYNRDAYRLLTALVTQLAVNDRVAGRANRAADLFG